MRSLWRIADTAYLALSSCKVCPHCQITTPFLRVLGRLPELFGADDYVFLQPGGQGFPETVHDPLRARYPTWRPSQSGWGNHCGRCGRWLSQPERTIDLTDLLETPFHVLFTAWDNPACRGDPFFLDHVPAVVLEPFLDQPRDAA